MTTRARINGILKSTPWVPQLGPQLSAFLSKADVTLYGGAAGSGKTDLAVGLALCKHRRTLFIRREAVQLQPVIDRMAELLGHKDGLNMTSKAWQLGSGRIVTFGGVPNPGDEMKYQGQSRDLLVIDEAANLLESQARFLMGWVRTNNKNQHCRVLMCSNPPTAAEGRWIVQYFAPWLDPTYSNPAMPGELRWFASLDGKEQEVGSPDKFKHGNEWITPQSRTFIPGKVTDNRFLRDSGYMATLQALPEPLRSQMLHGDFQAGQTDDEWQLIPTAWIQEAMDRWEPRDMPGKITSIGCDPARGGRDSTVIAVRHGWWFDKLDIHEDTPTGGAAAGLILKRIGNDFNIPVHLDVIGIGTSVFDHLEAFNVNVNAINGSARSEDRYDVTGRLTFANLRAEVYWNLRELLSPDTSAVIMLPPSQALLSELAATRYQITARGVQIEGKADIVKRLGKSPDQADAVAYCAVKSMTATNVTPIRVEGRGRSFFSR